MDQYIEQDCTVSHQGKSYTAGGAYQEDGCLIAYLGEGGVLTDWHGRELGRYRITSTWSTPQSWFSSSMHQAIATVDGKTYTGRSAGIGMIFKGKRIAAERNQRS